MRVLVAPSLLPLVPRSATFDSTGEAEEAAAALSGLGEQGAKQPGRQGPVVCQ